MTGMNSSSEPPMRTMEIEVVSKSEEAEQVFLFDLRRTDGRDLPPFQAGDHIDVHLPNGLVRQYSICNAPGESHRYVIAILKAPSSRGGSRVLADEVRQGDRLFISPPRNLFALKEGISFSLLIAGGIGITPLIAMAERLHQLGQSFRLHYCGRTDAAMAFRSRLANAPYSRNVLFHADDGGPEQRFDMTAALDSLPCGGEIYVCGPAGFIDAVFSTADRCGIALERLHREYFSPAESSAQDSSFTLRLAVSGRDIDVPAGRSAAEVLLESGITLPVSCERGVCGTCVTPVLGGIPDHRDMFLTLRERGRNDCFTPCCSRSKTPILTIGL